MAIHARFTSLTLALLLAGCGSAPVPVTPTPPVVENASSEVLDSSGAGGTGGGGGVVAPEPEESGNDTVEASPAPVASTSPVVVSPTPSPTPRPHRGGGGNSQPSPVVSPTPTPSPSASTTPTPTPTTSPTPAPETRSVVVDSSQHAVLYGPSSYLGGPLVVTAIDKNAVDNTSKGYSFKALAGIDRGRYGWTYKRVETLEDANQWTADVGNPGSVCFLDSVGGLADNSGSWLVHQNAGGNSDDQEIKATEHVTKWDPAKVAFVDLGAERSWSVSIESVRGGEMDFLFPGVFLVFTNPDGSRDFRIVNGIPQTIRTRGYVYAFYLTDGFNTPDQADRVMFKPE